MTTERPAAPRFSAEATSTAAVLSPVGAGVAWAALAYAFWDAEADRTGSVFGSLGALLTVFLPGLLGIGVLAIPLGIGVLARSVDTRLAAAWVESVVCGSAALVWFPNAAADAATEYEWLLSSFAATALLVPLAVTLFATRRVRARG